jgi:PAS domain-containing protein
MGETEMGNTICSQCGSSKTDPPPLLWGDVCDSCLNDHLSSRSDQLSTLLEDLQDPAAFVGRDLSVILANSRFAELFGKASHELVGRTVGEAIDCTSPSPDNPCGETFHCLQCGIRRFVELARVAGVRINGLPVTFGHKSGRCRTFKLTTESRGGSVFLMLRA